MQGKLKTFRIDSQNARVLRYLQCKDEKGNPNTLTCYGAITLGLTHNLRSRISNLKEVGYKIKVKKVKFSGGYFAEYSLINSI